MCVLALPKAQCGQYWHCLFRGDSEGARCLQPPYTLTGEWGLPQASLAGRAWVPDRQQAAQPGHREAGRTSWWGMLAGQEGLHGGHARPRA